MQTSSKLQAESNKFLPEFSLFQQFASVGFGFLSSAFTDGSAKKWVWLFLTAAFHVNAEIRMLILTSATQFS